MSQEAEETVSLPIACTPTPAELAAMRNGLLPGLLARASAKEPVVRFLLLVEPGDGPVWLEVTGPEGTEDFLSTLLDTMPETSNGR
jgi:hypothetical protein